MKTAEEMDLSECSSQHRPELILEISNRRGLMQAGIKFVAAATMIGFACTIPISLGRTKVMELEGATQQVGEATRTRVGAHPPQLATAESMQQEFQDAFRRGELSSSSLIHIDIPVRKWRFGFKHGQNLVPPEPLKLTHLEQETKEEMESDYGGLQRVEASSKHMANRINGIISSLQGKLDAAARARALARSAYLPAGRAGPGKPLGNAVVAPPSDLAWDTEMHKLNKVIREHGGVPKLHRMHHWTSLSRAEEDSYQDALRHAFGSKPPAGMGVF